MGFWPVNLGQPSYEKRGSICRAELSPVNGIEAKVAFQQRGLSPATSSQDTHMGGGVLTDAAGGASTSGVTGNLTCKVMTAMWKAI